MTSKERYISGGHDNRERGGTRNENVKVNTRTNLCQTQNRINDRRMDAGCNKGTILRYPSSQDFCGPHISGTIFGHAFYHMLCDTTNSVSPLCL